MKNFVYTGEQKREISFPLGGIGSGCIGLSGNGRFREWEIFNRPNKEGMNGFSHFAIKAESEGHVLDARVLHGKYEGSYIGEGKRQYDGIGFGVSPNKMTGIPHFDDVEFKGEFPIAELSFKDDKFPGKITMTAFNPFIPLNEDDSSIPGAFFEFNVENPTNQEITYTICLTVRNPMSPVGIDNQFAQKDGFPMMKLLNIQLRKNHVKYGDLTFATDAKDVSYQENWFQGSWYDGLEVFWHDFTAPGKLENRKVHFPKNIGILKKIMHIRSSTEPHASLAAHFKVSPQKTEKVRFIITWNFPNCYNYQKFPPRGIINELRKRNPNFLTSEKVDMPDMDEYITKWSHPVTWKNYYAILFQNSTKSALYSMRNWDRLYQETLEFKNALFSTTVPNEVIDAISGNIATLKSPTVLRLENGEFWGWEGTNATAGCCPGSCTHVWNYAFALPFLFPNLERSMRDLDYKYNLQKNGSMKFRLTLPLKQKGLIQKILTFGGLPCADGQFGGIIKTYREWKISGNTEWLKSHWDSVKKSLEFAWSEDNKFMWDRNRDGVLEGRQHNTLDVEFFGPNSWLTGFYLAALKAASEMARFLGEGDKADEYLSLFTRGKMWVDENLFNGEYYYQAIDLEDKSLLTPYKITDTYWNEEAGEIKYQMGEACHCDQVLAQWHANLCGLGDIFDREQVKSAIKSIYKYNFKPNLKKHFNPCRVFALENEGGLVVAEWPEGKRRPIIPAPYSEEAWPGIEYPAATLMVQKGLIKEGLEVVKAVRNRYNGVHRNPWSEIECGSNYARSMASYGLLLAFSGFKYNLVDGMIGFNPIVQDQVFKSFWALGDGWGVFEMNPKQVELKILHGYLKLRKIELGFLGNEKLSIQTGSIDINFEKSDGLIKFETQIEITPKNSLIISMS
jgi:uncharacterized protein (DUF608 family)